MSNSLQSVRQAAALQIRRARAEEIEPALRYILAASGRYAGEDQVRELREFVQQRNFPLANLWLGLREHTLLWAILPVINPGRTALLLQPDQFTDKTQELAAGECIDSVCADCKSRGVLIAQALISPEQRELISLHESLGFERVADLHYLQISPRKATVPPMLPDGYRWVNYSPESHEMFSHAILESYIDSLDCPKLNGRREINDVIAGHQSAGEFDARRWLVLCEGDTPVAVLLLNAVSHSSGLELVYLGIAPKARRKGLGALLMKQALSCAWSCSASRLTLAVDSQNAPALKLYYRTGMERIASKTALVRELHDELAPHRT